MAQSYIDDSRHRCGEAALASDQLQIAPHLLPTIDKVPKIELGAISGVDAEALKVTRYIWRKNPWHPTARQQTRLMALPEKTSGSSRHTRSRSFSPDPGIIGAAPEQPTPSSPGSPGEPLPLSKRRDSLLACPGAITTESFTIFDVTIDNRSGDAMNNIAKVINHTAGGYHRETVFRLLMIYGLGKLELQK
ncbi:MAG TPA: hypothetical protein VMU60_13250 [Syntrophobacteria bacterium]|nr:hypothetical protein [Syntrophobacteria bacterium]